MRPILAPARLRSAQDRQLLAVWLLLGVARAAVVLLPDRVVVRHLGPPAQQAEPGTGTSVAARRIGYLVDRAAARTPWTSDCYPRALVAAQLLRRAGVPHLVSLGVRRGADGLEAHAWVEAGATGVVGTDTAGTFTVVGRFPWR